MHQGPWFSARSGRDRNCGSRVGAAPSPAQSAPSACPQAFTSGLRRYLQYYRACVLSTPPTLSLIAIAFLFRKLGRQLR